MTLSVSMAYSFSVHEAETQRASFWANSRRPRREFSRVGAEGPDVDGRLLRYAGRRGSTASMTSEFLTILANENATVLARVRFPKQGA